MVANDNKNMTTEKKEEEIDKYLDLELTWKFKDQSKINATITAINAFIEAHKDGLTRTNYNVLGYSYY